MMPTEEGTGGSGRTKTRRNPKRQPQGQSPGRASRGGVYRRRPSPEPEYEPPSGGGRESTTPPPVTSNSSGQYSSSRGSRESNRNGRQRLQATQVMSEERANEAYGPGPIQGPGGGHKKALLAFGADGGGGGNRGGGKEGPPGIKEFLGGDTTYQNQLNELRAALESFRTDNLQQRGDTREDFRSALGRYRSERQDALEALEADFASRGLLNSGLYADAVADYNRKFAENVGDLRTDRSRVLGDLRGALGDQRDLFGTQRNAARLEALRRRAEQYNLGMP